MTDDVKPEVIKRTQDLLGKYFKKPPLTEKLLKKPPFRFLHDIVLAVIKETGFLDGLFTEKELNSDNIKDKEAKLAYLTKLIDVVKLISGSNLTVRANKIISGQEATKTNELLQAIGKALDKKISSTEAIEYYKKSSEKKLKSNSRSRSTVPKEEKRIAQRQTSQTRKSTEKDRPFPEQKRSSSTSKVKANETDIHEDEKQSKDHSMGKTIKENEEIHEDNKVMEIPPAEPVQSKISSSVQKKKHSSSAKSKQHRASTPQSELTKSNSVQSNSTINQKDESIHRKESTNKTTRSVQNSTAESQNQVSNDTVSSQSKSVNNVEIVQTDGSSETIENKDSKSVDGAMFLQSIDKSELSRSELQKTSSEDTDASSQQSTSRPRTSLRPPSARPSSARPAAPRMRAKTELMVNEEIPTPIGNISVIIENSDVKEDDDAEDMVVMETRAGNDSLDNNTNYEIDNRLTQEHGHLVAQILETQKELVNNEIVDVIPKKADIAWNTSSKRDREVVAKEIDKLRGTIQTLTRATNPLGKLLDYLQEDVEMMQKELLEWRSQYHQLNEQLEKEKIQTRESTELMKETLKEIDNSMKIQLDKICQTKSQIMKNDQKIQTLLNGHL